MEKGDKGAVMENSVSLHIGTKNQRILILMGFLSGALIFALKLCWLPIIQTILGNQIGPDDQPPLLSYFYRNIYLVPWCGAACFFIAGLLKKSIGKSLAFVTGLVFYWILFLLGMMVFFIFGGGRF
jgi:hypothetical protein